VNIRGAIEGLKSKPLAANVMKLAGGTAIGQLMVVAATPILTRIYSPEDMGLYGLFMSFIGFASVCVCLKYELAIVLAKDQAESDSLLFLVFLLVVPVSLFFTGVMAYLIASNTLSYGLLPFWSIAVAFIMLVATGVFISLRFWFVNRAEFSEISMALIGQGVCRALVPIGYGLLWGGWIGMLAGEVAGRLFGMRAMMQRGWPAIRKSAPTFSRDRCISLMRKYKKYPLIILPSTLVDAWAMALPLPMIASAFGVSAAGNYLLINRIAGLPAGFISASLADVFHNHAATVALTAPKSLVATLRATLLKLLWLGLAVYVPVALFAPFMFEPIFGSQWKNAGLMMAIYVPVPLIGLLVSPLSRILTITNRFELKLWVDFANLAVPVASFLGAKLLGYNFLESLVIFVVLFTVVNGFYLYLIWRTTCNFQAAQ
jgi:O-antigen/teichoic acid export membrane protein